MTSAAVARVHIWRKRNPEKVREQKRRALERNPAKIREQQRKASRKYYERNRKRTRAPGQKKVWREIKGQLLTAQGNCCGLCGTNVPGYKHGWHLDADHTVVPVRVRGVLCKTCNTGLGMFRHSAELFIKAAAWVQAVEGGLK